jgi:hypothetical protein
MNCVNKHYRAGLTIDRGWVEMLEARAMPQEEGVGDH